MTSRIHIAALAAALFVYGQAPVLGQSSATPPEPSRAGSAAQAADEVVVQGCLARDTAGGDAASPAFLLTHAQPPSASHTSSSGHAPSGRVTTAKPPQGPTGQQNTHADAMQRRDGATADTASDVVYRLIPARASVNLDPHVGHQMEVKGRVNSHEAHDAAAAGHRGSQAVQGGQMQGVGQTMQSGQGGQSGQSTQAPTDQPGRPLPPADGAAVTYKTLTVSSVRMIAASCPASR